MQTATARFTPWQRFIIAALAVLGVAWLSFWLVRSRNANPMVSVTFLGYTNVDARGGWQPFMLAHFLLANQGNASIACGLGRVEYLNSGGWKLDTNRLIAQHGGTVLDPGGTVRMAVVMSADAARLRVSFQATRMPSLEQYRTRQKWENWLNRLRIPWQPKPPTPVVVNCEVAAE